MIRRPGVDALAAMVLGAVLYELVTGGADLAVDALRRWRDRPSPPAALGQCGLPLYDGPKRHTHCCLGPGHQQAHHA